MNCPRCGADVPEGGRSGWAIAVIAILIVIVIVSAILLQNIAQAGNDGESDNRLYSPGDPMKGMNSNYASNVQVHELRELTSGSTYPIDLSDYHIPAGKKLLALNLTLTNKLKTNETVSDFVLITDDYTTHRHSVLLSDVPQTIGNRSSATFWVVFEVDKDINAASLEYAKPSYRLFVKL